MVLCHCFTADICITRLTWNYLSSSKMLTPELQLPMWLYLHWDKQTESSQSCSQSSLMISCWDQLEGMVNIHISTWSKIVKEKVLGDIINTRLIRYHIYITAVHHLNILHYPALLTDGTIVFYFANIITLFKATFLQWTGQCQMALPIERLNSHGEQARQLYSSSGTVS